MPGLKLNSRDKNTVQVINGSRTVSTDTLAAGTDVSGSTVLLHGGECEDGLFLRWSMAGSKAATNGTFTLALTVNGTAVCTCTSDDSTAVDFKCVFEMYCGGGATQKISGVLLLDTADPDVQYDAGTSNMQAGATIKIVGTTTSGDTLNVEYCIVERLFV